MKTLIFISLCSLLAACGDGSNYNRGYVISKSHVEPEVDSESSE